MLVTSRRLSCQRYKVFQVDIRIAALDSFRTSSGREVLPGEVLDVHSREAADLVKRGAAAYYSRYRESMISARQARQTRIAVQPSVAATVATVEVKPKGQTRGKQSKDTAVGGAVHTDGD